MRMRQKDMEKLKSATLGMLYAIKEVAINNRDEAAALFNLDKSEIDVILNASHNEMQILSENLTPGITLRVSPSFSKGVQSPLIRLMSVKKVIQ